MTYTVDAYGVRFTIDMTGTGDYLNDPTEAWDCAPRNEFIDEYVEQHKRHEAMRTSWDERQKIAATFGRSNER